MKLRLPDKVQRNRACSTSQNRSDAVACSPWRPVLTLPPIPTLYPNAQAKIITIKICSRRKNSSSLGRFARLLVLYFRLRVAFILRFRLSVNLVTIIHVVIFLLLYPGRSLSKEVCCPHTSDML